MWVLMYDEFYFSSSDFPPPQWNLVFEYLKLFRGRVLVLVVGPWKAE